MTKLKMEKKSQTDNIRGFSNVLNNSGGPRSRVRSETVNESYMSGKTAVDIGCYEIDIPEKVNDIEGWLLNVAEEIGWKGWKDINSNIDLPLEKLMVFNEPENDIQTNLAETGTIIRNALILSMSNKYCYLPDGPRIFTRSRLDRKIKLTKINIKNFYELE